MPLWWQVHRAPSYACTNEQPAYGFILVKATKCLCLYSPFPSDSNLQNGIHSRRDGGEPTWAGAKAHDIHF